MNEALAPSFSKPVLQQTAITQGVMLPNQGTSQCSMLNGANLSAFVTEYDTERVQIFLI